MPKKAALGWAPTIEPLAENSSKPFGRDPIRPSSGRSTKTQAAATAPVQDRAQQPSAKPAHVQASAASDWVTTGQGDPFDRCSGACADTRRTAALATRNASARGHHRVASRVATWRRPGAPGPSRESNPSRARQPSTAAVAATTGRTSTCATPIVSCPQRGSPTHPASRFRRTADWMASATAASNHGPQRARVCLTTGPGRRSRARGGSSPASPDGAPSPPGAASRPAGRRPRHR